jgi:hypothetical protein
MDDLSEILPLPKEIVHHIATYDRVLSIKRIPANDARYDILKTIPKKEITYYTPEQIRGWRVKFSNPHHILSMTLGSPPPVESALFRYFTGIEIIEDLYTYINTIDDDQCNLYCWD